MSNVANQALSYFLAKMYVHLSFDSRWFVTILYTSGSFPVQSGTPMLQPYRGLGLGQKLKTPETLNMTVQYILTH